MTIVVDNRPGHRVTQAGHSAWLHRLVTNWLIFDPSYIVTADPPILRNYQARFDDTKAVFLFGGRLRYVKLKPISAVVASLIVISGVLFWVFEASWIWHNISPAPVILYSYIWLLMVLFFIKASLGDPGVMPRNLHLPYDLDRISSYHAPDEYFNVVSLPYYGHPTAGVTVKYCPTCHIWRLPRMSHCGECNVCVANHDHHCKFLNNCVGARNYRYFLWLLLTLVWVCALQATLCMVHLFHYRFIHSPRRMSTFGQSASQYPVALLLSIIGIAGFIYPFLILLLHIYLTCNNFTTREYLNQIRPARQNGEHYVNVFDTGSVFGNLWLNWVATPQGILVVEPKHQYVPGDIRLENVPPLTEFGPHN